MESNMDQKLDMFLEKMAERFNMNNKGPVVAVAADESVDNGVHETFSKDRKLHRKEVAVSVY
jgi:hypothetical protein